MWGLQHSTFSHVPDLLEHEGPEVATDGADQLTTHDEDEFPHRAPHRRPNRRSTCTLRRSKTRWIKPVAAVRHRCHVIDRRLISCDPFVIQTRTRGISFTRNPW